MAQVVDIAPRRDYRRDAALKKASKRSSRKAVLARWDKLQRERQSWMDHWREVAEHVLPRRIRTFYETRQKGEKVHQKIYNSSPTRALRILSSGMMSGISSPARPWFRLITPNAEANEDNEVSGWLHRQTERMRTVFARSNVYNSLGLVYRDLGWCGTSPMCIEEDMRRTIRTYVYTPGTYAVQNSPDGTVDTVYHELPMTVGQIAERFGLENASTQLRDKFDKDQIDEVVRVLHVIEPNERYNADRMDQDGKRWRSCWYEVEGRNESDPDLPLWEANGYNEYPTPCPRWDRNDEDTWGSSPGMEALGDIKGLMFVEKTKLAIYSRIAIPPMKGPSTLKKAKKSTLSGDMTYVDTSNGSATFEPAYQIDAKALAIERLIVQHERRIDQMFYVDLFLMLANSDMGEPITAREVNERHEEKMLQLGPVLERLHNELLTPLIERTFEIMWRAGEIEEPPEALQGMELRVEFISILAQAQKLLGTVATERLLGVVGSMYEVFPEVKDKIDPDKLIDDYAAMLGTNPDIVVTGDALREKRDRRAEQEKLAAMAAAAKPLSDGANAVGTLAEADAQQPETINNLISTLQPNGPLPRPA